MEGWLCQGAQVVMLTRRDDLDTEALTLAVATRAGMGERKHNKHRSCCHRRDVSYVSILWDRILDQLTNPFHKCRFVL